MRAWWLLVVVLTGCLAPEPAPTPSPPCHALPASLDLGTVDVGATAQRVLPGLPPDTVTTVDAPFTAKLLEGALVLTATPTQLGAHVATLHVDQGCGAPATVQVTVSAVAPCVEVPSSLVFSPVERTCGRAAQTLTVTNRCASEVRLGATVVEPPDGPDDWCAGGAPCDDFHLISGAQTVSANSSTSLSLVATPAAVGVREATVQLQVHHLDGVSTREVALTATGLDRARVTERFDAPPRSSVEVLLVLDTSAAARGNWASLRYNLESLGAYFESGRSHRWHLWVHVAVADLSPSSAVVLDGDVVDLGVELPRVLEQLPVATSPSCVVPALRLAGAMPTVCIMYSPEQSPAPVSDALFRLRGSVSVVAPIDPWSFCAAQADDGRLEQLARRTQGVLENICTPDWATALMDVRAGTTTTTVLSLARPALRAPDRLVFKATSTSAELVVPRDERWQQGVDARGATVWTWDATTNQVFIEPLWSQYPGGPAVEVTYEPGCQEFP